MFSRPLEPDIPRRQGRWAPRQRVQNANIWRTTAGDRRGLARDRQTGRTGRASRWL